MRSCSGGVWTVARSRCCACLSKRDSPCVCLTTRARARVCAWRKKGRESALQVGAGTGRRSVVHGGSMASSHGRSDLRFADWMASLPQSMHTIPLTNLAIPGRCSFPLPQEECVHVSSSARSVAITVKKSIFKTCCECYLSKIFYGFGKFHFFHFAPRFAAAV